MSNTSSISLEEFVEYTQMNKEKPKDHSIQPVGLGNTRICPENSPHTLFKDTATTRELSHTHTRIE
jgi:hypothetical protein